MFARPVIFQLEHDRLIGQVPECRPAKAQACYTHSVNLKRSHKMSGNLTFFADPAQSMRWRLEASFELSRPLAILVGKEPEAPSQKA
jgi:hypothetical protein